MGFCPILNLHRCKHVSIFNKINFKNIMEQIFLSNSNTEMLYSLISNNIRKNQGYNCDKYPKLKINLQRNMNAIFSMKDHFMEINGMKLKNKIHFLNKKILDKNISDFISFIEKSGKTSLNKVHGKTNSTNQQDNFNDCVDKKFKILTEKRNMEKKKIIPKKIDFTDKNDEFKLTNINDLLKKRELFDMKIKENLKIVNHTDEPIRRNVHKKSRNISNDFDYDIVDEMMIQIDNEFDKTTPIIKQPKQPKKKQPIKKQPIKKQPNLKLQNKQLNNKIHPKIESLLLEIDPNKIANGTINLKFMEKIKNLKNLKNLKNSKINKLSIDNLKSELSNDNLRSKINNLKKIVETKKNCFDITTLLIDSKNKKWKGKWKNKIENKIIVKRELIYNFSEYDYQINFKKIDKINKILIKKFIIPKRISILDFYQNIRLSNICVKSKLIYSSSNDYFNIYENNEPIILVNPICLDKLNIHIDNYINTCNDTNGIFITNIDIEEKNNSCVFNITTNGFHKNIIKKEDFIMIGNLKINSFIKKNKIYSNNNIEQLEKWFNNSPHKVLEIKKNEKLNEKSNIKYRNMIVIEAPINYDIKTGHFLKKYLFSFINKPQKGNWIFKKNISNIKNNNGFGLITNKNMNHFFEIEFHTS